MKLLQPVGASRRAAARFTLAAIGLAIAISAEGCASLTNPVIDGIPVRRLQPEAFGESRADLKPVPLTALTPPPPDGYRLDAGDVLGIFIEGILGARGEQPPIRIEEKASNLPPAIGYPVPIRENGTVSLPYLPPLKVKGLTVEEAQTVITNAYLKGVDLKGDEKQKQLLKEGVARIIVTLARPRLYHVLVLREDTGGTTFGAGGGFTNGIGGAGTFVSQTRRTAGFPLDLPAYENDLLNALTRSGGLPGLEAQDEVLIIRGAYPPATTGQAGPSKADLAAGRETIRVPLRLRPGEQFPVNPADLVLQSGDVVHVRARIGDVFYTGGLLPPHAFPLPTDRDIDVLEAIALVGGPILNGGLAANNLSGQISQSGMGFPSPSLVTIIRKLKSGAQIPITVNLNRAFRDQRERIAIRPGDYLVLQATPGEAVSQYLISNLRFNLIGNFIHSRYFNDTVTYTAP
jgi:hypothetical protein